MHERRARTRTNEIRPFATCSISRYAIHSNRKPNEGITFLRALKAHL